MSEKSAFCIEFSSLPTSCHYLFDKNSSMHYKYIDGCDFILNSALVERGWRRFGKYFSRPNCKNCTECKNLRIDVENFTFSKNAKRILKKNKNVTTFIQKPTLSFLHLDIYVKYHKYMHQKRGWRYYPISAQMYNELYVDGAGSFGKEILYFIDEKLVGVDLVDFTNDGISSIYFFYDPDYSHLSLGKYSIYKQILLAKENDLRYIYLGYYVKNCQSLKYKADYKPHEILVGLPEVDEKVVWR